MPKIKTVVMDPRTALAGLALAISVVTFTLSFWYTWNSSIAAKRPILVFEYDGRSGWALRNIGNGPALNVVVAQKRTNGEWFNPVRIPPLAKDGELALGWLGHVNTTGLGATYDDYDGRPHTTTTGNDLSQVFRGARFGPWPEQQIGRHWNQPPYRE